MKPSQKQTGRSVPLVSFCTDYGHGSEGVGLLHGTILRLVRAVHIIDLTHDVRPFDVLNAAREFETVWWLPIGIHVCIVDPGVGSTRAALALEAERGDVLIGPDNGALRPAAFKLGGIKRAFAITNEELMQRPISATFHGRDVFASSAGWLASGVPIQNVGPQLKITDLAPPAFTDAAVEPNGCIRAPVIHINRYGTATLACRAEQLGPPDGAMFHCRVGQAPPVSLKHVRTFSDVSAGTPIVLADPYERVALAVNLGSFEKTFALQHGMSIELWPDNNG